MQKPLSQVYRDIKGIGDFVSALGAVTSLEVEHCHTWSHPQRDYLWQDFNQTGTRWGNGIDEDWLLSNFDQLVKRQDMAIARCIWLTASALPARPCRHAFVMPEVIPSENVLPLLYGSSRVLHGFPISRVSSTNLRR